MKFALVILFSLIGSLAHTETIEGGGGAGHSGQPGRICTYSFRGTKGRIFVHYLGANGQIVRSDFVTNVDSKTKLNRILNSRICGGR